jgi:acylphosphatase
VERRRAIVHGRVQGVWFRESARRRAGTLGAAGWVRNRPDGTVEAVVEGDSEAVAAMLDWLRVGPPDARVDRVDVAVERPEGLVEFVVRP